MLVTRGMSCCPGMGSEQSPGTGVASLAALPPSGASPSPRSLAFTCAQPPGSGPVLYGLSGGWAAPTQGSRVEGLPSSLLLLAQRRRLQHDGVRSVLQDAKKKYDKETEKYCGVLEKHLNLSSKKKESQLQEVRATSSFPCLPVTVELFEYFKQLTAVVFLAVNYFFFSCWLREAGFPLFL